MKKRNIIIGLVLTMALGLGVTAYAASEEEGTATTKQRLGLGKITSMRGQDYVSDVLKNKLGLTEEEIATALSEGKSLHNLAIEKGLTEETFRAALLEEKSNAIDTAVSEGKITTEEAVIIKEKLNDNIINCTGKYGEGQGKGSCNGTGEGQGQGKGSCDGTGESQGKGQGGKMMRNGQGSGCK